MPVLTLLDALRIQDFVFASNRLRDIVVGSKLVAEATSRPLLGKLAARGRVVFAAGGNGLLRFEDIDDARAFVGRYSRRLIEEFPGLELEVAHQPFESDGMYRAFREVQKKLRSRKLARNSGAQTLGLSVTAECVQTRAVATCRAPRAPDGEVALSAAMGKRRCEALAALGTHAVIQLSGLSHLTFRYPRELDSLGRSHDETSLIGVVHVDGNRVGQLVAEWMNEQRSLSDDELEEALGRLSDEIRGVGETAWQRVDQRVQAAIEPDPRDPRVPVLVSHALDRAFPLKVDEAEAAAYLPIRSILLGGDDLTFVCDGRIALDLARTALEAFSATQVPSFGRSIGACAGVAIVRSHAPFARAYDLAEALCRNAKQWLRERQDRGEYAMDWHVGTTAPLESLEALRERQYSVPNLSLTMRPYPLAAGARSFTWLDEVVLGPTGDGEKSAGGFQNAFWQRRRNKMKDLPSLARGGPERIHEALGAWDVTAKIDALPTGLGETGFDDRSTALLDAMELLDVHFPLRKVSEITP